MTIEVHLDNENFSSALEGEMSAVQFGHNKQLSPLNFSQIDMWGAMDFSLYG